MYAYRRANRPSALRRLRQLLVSAAVPESYPRTFHFRKSVVYIKFCLCREPWYVGSFTFHVYERDINRMSKFRQRCRQRLAYFEPASARFPCAWQSLTSFVHGISCSVYTTVTFELAMGSYIVAPGRSAVGSFSFGP